MTILNRVSELYKHRLAKVAALRESSVDPYPASVSIGVPFSSIRSLVSSFAPNQAAADEVVVSGRVISNRKAGKLIFATIRRFAELNDETMQVLLRANSTEESSFKLWKSSVDPGDWVSVRGFPGLSSTGEVTVFATSITLACKALAPFPDLHDVISNEELLTRNRHLEWISIPSSLMPVVARAKVLAALRGVFAARGSLEVETPILHSIQSGASARPFSTHFNALDSDVFLRIAPELFLKRLLVGGLERVYEIGRVFRNEGMDRTHNPEFTMLEAYESFSDYTDMAVLTKELILAAATAVGASTVSANGLSASLQGEWTWVSLPEAVSKALGCSFNLAAFDEDAFRAAASAKGVALKEGLLPGKMVLEVYEALVEKTISTPTFVYHFPTDVSPLSKPDPQDPSVSFKWDLIVCGVEVATGYSELNDPVKQAELFKAQVDPDDVESMAFDQPFLDALESGMPPAGGIGIGVDRLLMLLLGCSIREAVAFPATR